MLTEDELRLMASFPLSSLLLRRVRDLYIIMCWTGVRYSDLQQLTRDNIITDTKGNAYFSFRAAKNGRSSLVRILPEVDAVLEKYDGGRAMPRVPSNTRFNLRLDEMLAVMAATPQLASLNDPITRTFTALRPTHCRICQGDTSAMEIDPMSYSAAHLCHQYASARQ